MEMTDIYFGSMYAPAVTDVSDHLLDMSAYPFTDNFTDQRLREVTDDGHIYMLPLYYSVLGITYNKTLLDEHGWTLPTSFAELEELAPKVEAAGCDLALVSENQWYKTEGGYGGLDIDGVSGSIFPMPIKDQEIVAILPTGWRGNIETVTLTGARIKELMETGYIREGLSFPYQVVTPEGMTLEDDAAYTVAICGVTDEVAAEGNLTDTGVVVFLNFYNSYMDGILYRERLKQMQEVTTQLFSGLEDVVQGQWENTDTFCNYVETGKPQTTDVLLTFMSKQAELNNMETKKQTLLRWMTWGAI